MNVAHTHVVFTRVGLPLFNLRQQLRRGIGSVFSSLPQGVRLRPALRNKRQKARLAFVEYFAVGVDFHRQNRRLPVGSRSGRGLLVVPMKMHVRG